MNSSFAGWCWLGMLVCSVAASASFAEEPFEVLRPIPEVLRDVNRRFQSAPSLTISRGGRLWCVWHTGGEGEGNDNCAMMVTSGDGGDTWSGPLFAIDAPGELRVLDPGLWTDPNGKVWLFYAQVKDFWDGRGGVWVMHPVDPENAASEWTKARRISDGYLKNKPLLCRNGTLLLPVEFMNSKRSTVYASFDWGNTFSMLGFSKVPPPDGGFPENMIVEMPDERLRMFTRTGYGIGEAWSSDGGRTWTATGPSTILNTDARFFIGRLKSGALLLVKNGPVDKKLPARSQMTAFVSDDNADTWNGGRVLDERDAVSYPDAVEDCRGFIHVVHDRARQIHMEIISHRFTEADVRAGKLVSDGSRLKVIVNKAGPNSAVN